MGTTPFNKNVSNQNMEHGPVEDHGALQTRTVYMPMQNKMRKINFDELFKGASAVGLANGSGVFPSLTTLSPASACHQPQEICAAAENILVIMAAIDGNGGKHKEPCSHA